MKRSATGAAAADGLLLITAVDGDKFPAPSCVCVRRAYSQTPQIPPPTLSKYDPYAPAVVRGQLCYSRPGTGHRARAAGLPFGSNLIKTSAATPRLHERLSGVLRLSPKRQRERERRHMRAIFLSFFSFFTTAASAGCRTQMSQRFLLLGSLDISEGAAERSGFLPWNAENVNIKGLI